MTTNDRERKTADPSLAMPRTLRVLAIIVGLETLMLAAWTLWYAAGFFTDTPDSLGGAIVILILSLVAAVWLAFATVGLLRRQTWTRAATLVWQLCQVAVAAGAFQGLVAPADAGVGLTAPVIGTALLVPALCAGVLLFTPSVVTALRRDPQA